MIEDPWIVERSEQICPRISLLDEMVVERGTIEDWRLLSELHYKQSGSLPAGSHHWRLRLRGETIGVLVMASPKLLLKERHVLFPNMKPGNDTRTTNVYRMKFLNANFQVVARVVVDTMYRGAGLAYRFTNLAARMEGKRYIEIQSSMSKYNMFAQRAGFKFVKPMRSNKYELGIKFFRQNFESNPADLEAMIGEMLVLPDIQREALEEKCRHFYLRNSALENTGKSLGGVGERRVAKLPIRSVLSNLQQMVLASPLYGVYVNPDPGITLPETLPLAAFDWQGATEKFNMERYLESS